MNIASYTYRYNIGMTVNVDVLCYWCISKSQLHKALNWLSLFKYGIYLWQVFLNSYDLKLSDIDVNFREVLQEIKTKQQQNTGCKSEIYSMSRAYRHKGRAKASPRPVLVTSRQEQKQLVCRVHLQSISYWSISSSA